MLKDYMEQQLSALPGNAGAYFKNLSTGETILYTKDGAPDRFLAASVIKLFIMAEAYHQIDRGILSSDMRIILKEEDKVPTGRMPDYAAQASAGTLPDDMFPESGVLNYIHEGAEFSIRDLIRLMIVISDNTATNMLIRVLGMDHINELIATLDMKNTRLNRLLFDENPDRKGLENTISLVETGCFLERIFRRKLISKEASGEMSAILQNQQLNYKIPFYLHHLPIAHKTGEDNGIVNDVAIVYSRTPFILCFSANGTDIPAAERACQELAREAWLYSEISQTASIRAMR